MGIVKAYMISTLHNIEIFRFDHDRNKLFIFSNFFPTSIFHILCNHDQDKSLETVLFFYFFQLIFSTLSLMCVSFPIHNLSVLFLFVNKPEKTKKINFIQSKRYIIFGVVSSANCEICILCVCSSIFIWKALISLLYFIRSHDFNR
jgi:hypothetical protein